MLLVSDPSPHRQQVGSATPPQGGSYGTESFETITKICKGVSQKSGGATTRMR